MTIKGYEIITEKWKPGSNSHSAMATKDGKQYFVKRYDEFKEPIKNDAMDRRTYETNKKLFEKFVSNRKKINAALRKVALPGGNIIAPVDEFIYEHQFYEVTEMVSNIISQEEIEGGFISTLSEEAQDMLLRTIAGAIMLMHKEAGVVHTDLKLPNILISEVKKSENYVGKIIDFDISKLTSEKYGEIGGTSPYMAPEQVLYCDAYSDAEEGAELEEAKALSEKMDVFALGIVFHQLLAYGEFPTAGTVNEILEKYNPKFRYASIVLLNDCELKLSSKIKNYKYLALIYDMLERDPKKRLSAEQVLARLQEKTSDVVIEEAWSEDKILVLREKLEEAGYKELRKNLDGDERRYALRNAFGRRVFLTAENLVEQGLARRSERYEEPWSEHNILLDLEKIKAKKYLELERVEIQGVKGYYLYRSNGTRTFQREEMLVALGYAKKITKEVELSPLREEFNLPWPEHNITFDIEKIKAKNYVAVYRFEVAGTKCYAFMRANRTRRIQKLSDVLMLGYAQKK